MKNWTPIDPPFRSNKAKVFSQAALTGQFIYQLGEPGFREHSAVIDVKVISTLVFKKKLTFVKKSLLNYRKKTGMGRGISAVQVGIKERVAVIYMPEAEDNLFVMINPVVTKVSDKKLRYPEICMSAHPLVASVVRPAWIEFDYLDCDGLKQHWQTKAETKEGRIYNRVFQHEIDHLNGIINIDHVAAKELIFALDPLFYEQAAFEEIN